MDTAYNFEDIDELVQIENSEDNFIVKKKKKKKDFSSLIKIKKSKSTKQKVKKKKMSLLNNPSNVLSQVT